MSLRLCCQVFGGVDLGVKLLDDMLFLHLTSWGTTSCFPQKLHHFTFPPKNTWDFSNCSTSLSNLLFSVFCLFVLFWIRAFLCVCVHLLSCVWSFATPWTIAHQASLSMGFFWQEYWSRLPFLPPRDLLNPQTESTSPALQVDSLPLSCLESPRAFLIAVKWYFLNYCLLMRKIKLSISFFAFWYLKKYSIKIFYKICYNFKSLNTKNMSCICLLGLPYNIPQTGGLNSRNLLFSQLEARSESKIEVLAGLVLSEGRKGRICLASLLGL